MDPRTLSRIGLWLVAVALLPGTAAAGDFIAPQYQSNKNLDACQATERLADFLADCQVPGPGSSVGWTWEVGRGVQAPNMAGLVSLALLDAYEATGQLRYLRAAQRYADGLLVHPRPGLPFKSDVELMVRLYGHFDDPDYANHARGLFDRIREASPTGRSEIDRIAKGRKATPALLGYDAAMAIRAALSVDERRYAYALADRVIALSGTWYRPVEDRRFTLVSTASLVSALETLDEAHYRRTIDQLRARLANSQASSGAWLSNETQPSAQAALALLYSPQAAEREASQRAVRWLISTLLQQGSLATFNDYMPEPFVGAVFSGVNAEALTTLASACSLNRSGR